MRLSMPRPTLPYRVRVGEIWSTPDARGLGHSNTSAFLRYERERDRERDRGKDRDRREVNV